MKIFYNFSTKHFLISFLFLDQNSPVVGKLNTPGGMYMLIVTNNSQTEQNHKLQSFPNKIIQINEWKYFNVCFFIHIETVQFHTFSRALMVLDFIL